MGTFVISKRFNGEFKFVFSSRKGKVIYTSQGYALKSECEHDIEVIRQKVTLESFQKAKAANGKYFFKIGINQKLYAVSRKYSTELRMLKGIDEIIRYGSVAETLDFSDVDFIFSDDIIP